MSPFYKNLLRPLIFSLDAETAHNVGLESLRLGLSSPIARRLARSLFEVPEFSPIDLFGLKFRNPLGMAAGFDKNAVAFNQLSALGFSFVETGTVTPQPQSGNPRPRMFRIPQDEAIINRLGFNNDGAAKLVERISSEERECIVGVNIGKNRDVEIEDAPRDYLECFRSVKGIADYVVVNVSSPNTPGLRNLQAIKELERIIDPLIKENSGDEGVPILLKLAPDLVSEEFEALADFSLSNGISGLVLTNTTVSRPRSGQGYDEQGGLSGRPLADLSDKAIRSIFRRTGKSLPIIGVGGVCSGEDLMRKIRLGASLVQVYTGFVYGGPGFPSAVLQEFRALLDHSNVRDTAELTGLDA